MENKPRQEPADESPEDQDDDFEDVTVVLPDDPDEAVSADSLLAQMTAKGPDAAKEPDPAEGAEPTPGRGEGLRQAAPDEDGTYDDSETDRVVSDDLIGVEGASTSDLAVNELIGIEGAKTGDLGVNELIGIEGAKTGDLSALATGEIGHGLPGPRERQPTIPVVGGTSLTDLAGSGEDYDLDGEETEEVFVILPEHLEGDEIPVVETQIVEGDFEDTAVTEVVHDDLLDPQGLENTGTEFVTEIVDEPTQFADDDEYEGPTQVVDDGDFEQLTTDLDDDVLGSGGDGLGHFDEFDIDESDSRTSSGSRMKPLFGLVAVLALLGVGGFYAYDMFFKADNAQANAAGNVDPVGSDPATQDPVAVGAVGGETLSADPTDVSQILRDRVTLALDTGFQVEVTDE